jgi:cytochrome P450
MHGRDHAPTVEILINSKVPHRLIEDDWYEGYLIPKGTTVVANIW